MPRDEVLVSLDVVESVAVVVVVLEVLEELVLLSLLPPPPQAVSKAASRVTRHKAGHRARAWGMVCFRCEEALEAPVTLGSCMVW